jgi:hypothetical protein
MHSFQKVLKEFHLRVSISFGIGGGGGIHYKSWRANLMLVRVGTVHGAHVELTDCIRNGSWYITQNTGLIKDLHLLTNCTEQSPSSEAESHSANQEIPPSFYITLRFMTVFTRASHGFLS